MDRPFWNFPRLKAGAAALFLLPALLCPSARGADKNKKPEKEKPEKVEPWVEIRTAHFIVASDGGEKTARRFADEFETLARVFQATMPDCRVSTGIPVRILASRDGKSFARVFPEFPSDSRHEQPPGVYLQGPEKTYIGLRANVGGRFQYADIFEKLAQQVLKLSYRNLPPWLEEGYSTVYSNLSFTDRGVRLERPNPEDLSVLYESPLLPLDSVILHENRTSAYVSSGNKETVFFAESRVLVHFLLSDQQFSSSKALSRYTTAVVGGADPVQAGRQIFGDLGQLQSKLDAYVKQVNGVAADIPVSGGSEAGSPRTLTASESAARIADFLALRGRTEDAQDRLEEALKTQPSLAEAEQSLGFLHLKRNELDDAQTHFDQAAQIDPRDALTFYGQGLVAMAKGGSTGVPAGAVEAFEKTVALNSEFAPAWYSLAVAYALRDDMTQKALAAAQKAASLAPGDSAYQLQVASLLNRAGRTEEARKTAASVQETASDRTTANKAGDLVARMSQPQVSAPAPVSAASTKAPSDSGLRIERKTEPEDKTGGTSAAAASPKPEPPPAPVPPLFSETPVYSMVGTISDVNCANAPQVHLTLKSLAIVMKLHAEDLAKVSFKSSGSAGATKGVSCTTLRGKTARISYLFVTGKPWDAEIQSVEFRSLQ